MKIVNDLGIKRYDNNASKLKKTDAKKYTGSFDEITIHGSEEILDRNFAKQCADKIKKELRNPNPESLIRELRQKIENDEYKVDYDRLLRKIMLED